MREIWLASIAAVIVQPLVLVARFLPELLDPSTPIYGLGFVVVATIVVSAAFVLVLGIPAFLLLRRKRRDGWLSLSLTGFLVGALPFALLSWPKEMPGYTSGGNWHGRYVEFYHLGAPTEYGWHSYVESVAVFGIHGLIGALTFFAVWRRLHAL
jgi:hypothetical protein